MNYKRIRSLERGVAVLRYLNQTGAATASDIAQHIDLPRPTVYRILDTLAECGLIYRSPSAHKVCRLAGAVGLLSENLHSDPISLAARSILHAASPDLSWPVFLSTLTDESIVIRETTRGSSVFWTELGWIGSVAPVWEVASGRIFAAFSTGETQARLLAKAPCDAVECIQAIAAQGYANERDDSGRVVGIAVPVGKGMDLIGALAMVWDAEAIADGSLTDGFLTLLRDLSEQILAMVHAIEAESRSKRSTRPRGAASLPDILAPNSAEITIG